MYTHTYLAVPTLTISISLERVTSKEADPGSRSGKRPA